jgi:hypothetical protein
MTQIVTEENDGVNERKWDEWDGQDLPELLPGGTG